MKEQFEQLLEKLTAERDEINLQMHLASMEIKDEFSDSEGMWEQVKQKASEIADDSVETTDEFIAAAKVVGEELGESYQRIVKRLED